MAATVIIYERTGAGPTNTDITSTNSRYMMTDATSASATTNPLQIPSSGTNYSYWKSRYLNASTTPTGTIDTVKYYTDGANGYGTGVTEKVSTASSLTYVQATGSATSGTQLSNANYSGSGTPVNSFTYTSGASLSITGSISNPSTGKISDFWVEQLEVASTATPGTTSTETKTITYNET